MCHLAPPRNRWLQAPHCNKHDGTDESGVARLGLRGGVVRAYAGVVTASDVAEVTVVLALTAPHAALILPFLESPSSSALISRYREPHRHYHDVTHIREVFAHIAQVAEQFQQLRPALYAALYHDAIYDSKRKDNEARSAELARAELSGLLDESELRVVSELVVATASHGAVLAGAHPDVGLFLDCDSAILGADAARYREYAAGVRLEYGHVSKLLYRLGRGKFLKGMLKRSTFFHTTWFEARYGEQARTNLRAELKGL
jgi:predicted metal-dependent HD superfamily phosphohydrolase